MKTTLEKMWIAYTALGKAKVSRLEESEVIKVLRARKAMRPYVEELRAFEEDVEAKLKPDGFDETANIYNGALAKFKANKDYVATKEEDESLKAVTEFFRKKERAMQEEFSKEVELNLEFLSVESEAKLLAENGWEPEKLDEILIIKQE